MPKRKKQPHNGVDKTEQKLLTFVRSADFRAVYANYVRVNFNAFDVSMLFGQAAPIPDQQNKVGIEMTARVTMGVIEAKLLIQMLTSIVGGFEKKYGAVQIPDDVKIPSVEVAPQGV